MKKVKKTKKIIFLYAQLTPYFIGCLKYFCESNPHIEILVIYDNMFNKLIINNNCFEILAKKKFKNKVELLNFCIKFNPNLLIVSGRMYHDYLYVALKIKEYCKRVTVQDTIYKLSLKQLLNSIFSNSLYKKYFDFYWGVGKLQEKFALSIGFNKDKIYNGFYVADKIFFDSTKKKSFNSNNLNLLFVGRLVKEKNILRLVKIVDSLNNKTNSNNKLTIIGDGYLKKKITKYNCVNFRGLLHQKEIIKIALTCDVFILPSIYEPWGVVTHEMAALGLPILISKLTGSSFDLVEDGINGFTFNPKSNKSMIKAIKKFFLLSDTEKKEFSLNSIKKSNTINHNLWNKTLIDILENNENIK